MLFGIMIISQVMCLLIILLSVSLNTTKCQAVVIENLNSVHYYDTASKTNKMLYTIRINNTSTTPILVWFNEKEKFSKKRTIETKRLSKLYNDNFSIIKRISPKSYFDFIFVIESDELVLKETSAEWLIQRIHYIEADDSNFVLPIYPYNDLVILINE